MSEHNSRLMSIGEVAKSLHITRRMILNYEDKGILLPDVKTGSGGNRYYTPETLTRIRAIRRLQTLGISLDEIKLYSRMPPTCGISSPGWRNYGTS